MESNQLKPDREVLFVEEVAAIMAIGRSSAYAWIKEGPPFPVHRRGSSVRIPRKSFYEWFDGRKSEREAS